MEKVVPQFNDGGTSGIVPDPQQHQRYVQLKKMLDDSEWASAYDDRKELHQALVGLISAAINNELELDQETLQILALEAEDYEDFRAFREEWIRPARESRAHGTLPREFLVGKPAISRALNGSSGDNTVKRLPLRIRDTRLAAITAQASCRSATSTRACTANIRCATR